VYENILLGNPDAGFEDVVQACRLAEVHEVIEALPEGYQTWLGEHGAGLSGGQKQRIAIARALLKRPAILLFDEATSQLDGATARALTGTLNRLKGRLSIIVVAHEVPDALDIDGRIEICAKGPAR
jgi:subfamily B ATP-binding cassette protein HlyB/CyaB